MIRTYLRAAVLAAALLPPNAPAQTEEPVAPGELPDAALGGAPVLPDDNLATGAPDLDWQVSVNLQGDALATSDQPSDLERAAELRRARIGGVVDWDYDWRFRAGVDLANDAELRDLAVEYRHDEAHLLVGRFIEPFGVLQSGASGSALMERPQALGLAPGYGVGVAASLRGEAWGFTGGVFSATRNDELFGGRKEDAVTLRFTAAPWRSDDALLHVGLAGSLREPDEVIVRFVAIPESILLRGLSASSALLVGPEGPKYMLYGAEVAALVGPVLLQSELIRAQVKNAIDLEAAQEGQLHFVDPGYTAWYAEAGWMLTGERRDYSVRRGVFSGIDPQRSVLAGGWGAFELAARYSFTDLLDPVLGGDEGRVASVGLAWYADPRAKLVLEGLRIEEDDREEHEEATAVQLRAQLYFTVP